MRTVRVEGSALVVEQCDIGYSATTLYGWIPFDDDNKAKFASLTEESCARSKVAVGGSP